MSIIWTETMEIGKREENCSTHKASEIQVEIMLKYKFSFFFLAQSLKRQNNWKHNQKVLKTNRQQRQSVSQGSSPLIQFTGKTRYIYQTWILANTDQKIQYNENGDILCACNI